MTMGPSSDSWTERVAPVMGSTTQTRRTYDRLARFYNVLEAPFEHRTRVAGLQLLGARPGERILEIGPGTGLALRTLARAVGTQGRVVGVDLSAGMINVARRRTSRQDLPTPPLLVHGDGRRLPFGLGTFDAVTMSFTLELIPTPDIPIVLGECRLVLRPGGRIVVVALDLTAEQHAMTRLYLAGHRRWPHLVDCRPIPLEEVLASASFTPTNRWSGAILGLPVAAVEATH